MSIGERIIELRKEKNLSQQQLALALDVSRQAVSKWANDLASPDTIKLIQLADVLDTEVEYLATGVKPVYESPPIVVNIVKKPDFSQEKMVEKIVERVVEKPVAYAGPVVQAFRRPWCIDAGFMVNAFR